MGFPSPPNDEEMLQLLRSKIEELAARAAGEMLAILRRKKAELDAGADAVVSKEKHLVLPTPLDVRIPTVDVYGMEPWEVMEALATRAAATRTAADQRDEAIFFSRSRRNSAKGSVRTAGGGKWLSSQFCKIYGSGVVIGKRTFLKFRYPSMDDKEASPTAHGVSAGRKRKREQQGEAVDREFILFEYTLTDSFSWLNFEDVVICRMKIRRRQGSAGGTDSETADGAAEKFRKDLKLEQIQEASSSISSSAGYSKAGVFEELLLRLVILNDAQLEAALAAAVKAGMLPTHPPPVASSALGMDQSAASSCDGNGKEISLHGSLTIAGSHHVVHDDHLSSESVKRTGIANQMAARVLGLAEDAESGTASGDSFCSHSAPVASSATGTTQNGSSLCEDR